LFRLTPCLGSDLKNTGRIEEGQRAGRGRWGICESLGAVCNKFVKMFKSMGIPFCACLWGCASLRTSSDLFHVCEVISDVFSSFNKLLGFWFDYALFVSC
jgi:hypothetical protein